MSLFTTDFVEFFKELAQNNHKDWFHANKKRYEKSVKGSFEQFVSQLISAIQEHDPELQIGAKDAIGRINRDIRFAKDKSPYNLHMTAFISRAGKKDKSLPGFFIRLSPEMIGIMTGSFGPDKTQLKQIRQAILEQSKKWEAIVTEANFSKQFGAIRGDKNKRLETPFKEAVAEHPILANKQFYAVAELSPDLLTQDKLISTMMEYWHTAQPFTQFLKAATAK